MVKATVTNGHYTVGSAYQWDRNHVLEVHGMSVAGVPELHFAHGGLETAVVQPTTIDASGVLRALIPNDMLEQAQSINAYVCTKVGASFQSLLKIVVPVHSRPRPTDSTEEVDASA